MPQAGHSGKQLDDKYDKWKVYRELDTLHDRINDLLLENTVANAAVNLKVNYVAVDLDTAIEIATALNLTNARVNSLAASINAVLEKIRSDL